MSDTITTWRQHTDDLTPAQVRHLEAVERLALGNLDNPAMRDTATDTLDSLGTEAAWYASQNATAGDRDADCLDRLRLLIHEVDPSRFDSQDMLAVISLLQRALAAKGVI
jgi:hypothetical protein